jgi:predicted transcriptional regulator
MEGVLQMSTITVKRRKEIKRHLNNIADGCEKRMPLWTVVDLFTVRLMRDAAAAIDALENQSKRKASK